MPHCAASGRHRIEGELHPEPRLVDDADDVRVRRRLDHRADAAGVLDGEGDGIGAELGVERHRHDAGAHGAVHHLDELEAVADRHGEPVARLEPELDQQGCEAVVALVQLAIAHLAPGATRKQLDELELGNGQGDAMAVPERPADVAAQFERAQTQARRSLNLHFAYRLGAFHRLNAGGNEVQTLQQNREAAGLLHEVERTTMQRDLFVDLIGQ